MNGIEAAGASRKQRESRYPLSVIDWRERCLDGSCRHEGLGAIDFIEKPVGLPELQGAVALSIRRRTPRRPPNGGAIRQTPGSRASRRGSGRSWNSCSPASPSKIIAADLNLKSAHRGKPSRRHHAEDGVRGRFLRSPGSP